MNPPFAVNNEIIHLISSISSSLGGVNARGIKVPEPLLRKKNRIKTIHDTLAIEGNTLTIDQVSAILDGKKIIGPPNEIQEVQNTILLYEKMESFRYASVKDFLLAHKILMARLIKTNGQFRSKNVGVLKGSKVSHIAPKHIFVTELIENLFDWAKTHRDIHPLILSCVLHYEIEFIHPFEDGNGRMGRFWQSLILSKFHPVFKFLPIESIIKNNQKIYYKTLEKCDKSGNSTLFIEFMLKVILEALEDFSQSTFGVTLTSQDRIKIALSEFSNKDFSRKDYMILCKNISSATASRDLQEAVAHNQLMKIGRGNQTRYRFKIKELPQT